MAGYKLPKVTQYVKNVGKSVAYASIDAIKSNMPGISDFMEANEDIMKEMYSGVRNYKQSLKTAERNIKQSGIYKAIEVGAKNLLEDVKSGNFYNDRTNDNSEALLGLDDDFDMEFSSGSESQSSSKALADSINNAVGAAAISQGTAVAKSTNLMIKSSTANTKLLMGHMDKISATFTSGMGAVYTAITTTNQFLNGPMFTHLENSRKYYEESTKLLREQTLMMKELLEMQRNIYKKEDSKYSESRYSQSTTSYGAANLRGYFKNVKSNLRDMLDAQGFGMMDMGGMNPLMLMAQAPLKMAMEGTMNRFLPKDFKKSLRSFDQGLTGLFAQLVARANSSRDNNIGFLQTLGELFGIKLDAKKNINPGAYKKDAVPFDGITRQAIIETIPGYLARIEAAITNSGERHYDYQSGTWKSAKHIQKSYNDEYERSVLNANMAWMDVLKKEMNGMAEELKASVTKSANAMAHRIYKDSGDFDRSKGAAYYGMDNKTFEEIMRILTDEKNGIRAVAGDTAKSIQRFAADIRRHEENGSPYRQLFNGAYDMTGVGDGKKHDPKDFATNNLLTLAEDSTGKNIFYYLRGIYESVSGRHRQNLRGNRSSGPRTRSRRPQSTRTSEGSQSTSSSDDSEPGGEEDPDLSNLWGMYDETKEEEAKKAREAAMKFNIKNWVRDKLGDSPVSKVISSMLGGASSLMSKPFDYATKLLKRADESMFKMMFGNKEYKLRNGEKADNVFQYILDQVKGSFEEITNSFKDKFKDFFNDKLKPVLQPLWDKYGQPVWEEMKGMGRQAKNRVRQTYDRFAGDARNIYENVRHNRRQRMYEDIFSGDPDEMYETGRHNSMQRMYERLFGGGVVDSEDIKESAYGRIVTKRGLTMISPGEIIIPASFDKRKQRKMLLEEKKEKKRIVDAIGFNAEGNIGDDLKSKLHQIYNENVGHGAKNTAGGIIGAGAGLLAGVNPLLGAMAGAGLSILSNSKSFQKMIFGEDILDENGNVVEHKGGIISKKIQDIFKKSKTDMIDFGIGGGLLGLFTPFGPLGGAAIGAGIGMLKNSESFKKFIFGDAETGKDGLISKESYEKFKGMVKKAAPNMAIGAVGGALLGPFGLLGNAAMGAGLGLLSSTDGFKKFIFGDAEEGKPRKGLMGAIERGIIDPAKEKIKDILDDFKGFAKKNIFDPMKNFFEPFAQSIKNVFTEAANGVKDHLNKMFEETLGIPIHDFLQEKLFKPMTKFIFTLIKAPLKIGANVVTAPLRLLGAAGNSLRMRQIRRGTAGYMTAEERLKFREDNPLRNWIAQKTGQDRYLETDKMLANMSADDLQAMGSLLRDNIDVTGDVARARGEARAQIGDYLSTYMNSKDADGKIRYHNKMGINQVRDLARLAAEGNLEEARNYLYSDYMNQLSGGERDEVWSGLEGMIKNADNANSMGRLAKAQQYGLSEEMQKWLGNSHIMKNPKEARRLLRMIETQQKAGGAIDEKSEEAEATDNLTEVYKDKTDDIIDKFRSTNDILQKIYEKITGEKWKRSGSGGDSDSGSESGAGIISGLLPEAPTIDADDVANAAENAFGGRVKNTGRKIKGKILSMVSPGEKIIDKDSKEAVEQRQLDAEKLKAELMETDEIRKTNTILSELKEKLIGSEENKSVGLLGKIWSGSSKLLKFLGVGGKIAIGAASLSLYGHASEWFKQKIMPMFTNENSEIKKSMDGMLGKAKGWWDKQGGLYGMLSEKVIPYMVEGWGLAMNNIVTPLVTVAIKNLPGMLWDLGKAILKGLKDAITGKTTYSRNKDAGSSAVDELNRQGQANAKAIKSGSKTPITIKASSSAVYDVDGNKVEAKSNNVKKSGIDGILGGTKRTNEIQYDENGNIITEYDRYNSDDSLVSNLAHGATRSFIKGATTGQGAGKVATWLGNIGMKKSGARKFLSHLPGGKLFSGAVTTTKGAAKVTGKTVSGSRNLGAKFADFLKGDIAERAAYDEWFKQRGGAAAANAAEARNLLNKTDDVADAANKTGGWMSKIKDKFFTKSKDTVAKVATKGAKEGVEEAAEKTAKKGIKEAVKGAVKTGANTAKNGITKTLTKLFGWIADSAIGGKIVSLIGKGLTKGALSEKLLEIAAKIGSKGLGKVAGKGLTKLASALAGATPIGVALAVADFANGMYKTETILGIPKSESGYQVSWGQRIICGLIHMLNERFLLGIIPTETLADIFIDTLGPLLGINMDKLKEARSDENVNKVLDEWNKANPDETYDNLEDFNKKDSWGSKAKRALKNVFNFGKKKEDKSKTDNSKTGKGKGQITKFGMGKRFGFGTDETTPEGAVRSSTNKFTNAASSMVNKAIISIKSLKASHETILQNAAKGNIDPFSDKYWKMEDKSDDPVYKASVASQYIEKLYNAPLIALMGVFNNIQTNAEGVKDAFLNLMNQLGVTGNNGGGVVKKTSWWSRFKSKFGFGKVSQLDPAIAGMQYNGHTMGEAGCGPVAATNLINSLGGGMSVQDAANYATSHGYKSRNEGTRPEYMNSILNASGIANKNISGSGQIDHSLKNGNPVVLMGRGNSNSSPYGASSPHYITAMGYDRSGNIIVDDPYESGYSTYRKADVMNGVMNSISVNGRGGFGKRRYRYGLGMDSNLKSKVIGKTIEITNAAEGGYYSINKNDNGSWSVGIAQFHLGHIETLFNNIANRLTGDAKQKALKYASWKDKVLTDTEANEVIAFMKSNSTVCKEEQENLMFKITESNIATPLAMFDNGKDYRSVILAGDIGNTGPGLLDGWRSKYRGTTQDKELAHVRDSLKSSDSWWGRQQGNQYYQGWMNRIDNAYNALSGWSADGYTPSYNFSEGGGISGGGSNNNNSNSVSGLIEQLTGLGDTALRAIYGSDFVDAFSNLSGGGSSNGNDGNGTPALDSNAIGNVAAYINNIKPGETPAVDYGSGTGTQCVELANHYLDSIFGTTDGKGGAGNGNQWAKLAADKDHFPDRMTYYGPNTQPQAGDVISLVGNQTQYGHAALVKSVKDNKLTLLEQWNGSKTIQENTYDLPGTGKRQLLGIARPTITGSDTEFVGPTAPTAGTGYGKGFGGGRATAALRANSAYANAGYGSSTGSAKPTTNSNGNYVDYTTFLQTIVTVLTNIADNTGLLSKVLEILSDKFNLDLDKSDIEKAAKKSRAQSEQALNELIQRNNQTADVSKMINNKDTAYVLQAMKALATE